jgi:hypothetical protein
MDAEERHGFEGDGFTYLKSPIWWAGIIACMRPHFFARGLPLTRESDHRRNSEFCSIRLCARDSSDPAWGTECPYRSCVGVIFLEGRARHLGEAWMRDMSNRVGHNRFTRTAGPRD